MTQSHAPICIVIPYKDQYELLSKCLESLSGILCDNVIVLLIDDGSDRPEELPERFRNHPQMIFIRNVDSLGPAAARNKGVAWCRKNNIHLLILLDSDCVASEDFIEEHVRLHKEHPDVTCIGGAIEGYGTGLWAKIDGIASWFTSLAQSPSREVKGLYHIPTTNMSIKLHSVPLSGDLFNEKLRTGEDVKFIHDLRQAGGKIFFCPTPVIRHKDREHFVSFFKHQYRWGLHTYAMRFGGKGGIVSRMILACGFFFLIPVFAFVSTVINILPWIKISKTYFIYFIPLYILYLCKGIGVMHGIIRPASAMYK